MKKIIKRGFTLIELLAVIVILSIILVIAVPAILKNINDSKKSVFQESADLIIKVIDQIIISDSLDSSNILEEEITDSYRCITLSEATSFGLNPAHYDIGYDNGSDTTCSQVAYRDGKTYVRLVANATGKFAGIQPLSSPGYLPTPIECFTFDIPTAKITGYNLTNPSCSREVSIPEKINGVVVRIIGDSAFEGKQITGVEIPYGVTTIEYDAFWKNQLTEVTIPNSVTTLGDYAFQNNQLTSIIIPDSVTTLGDSAFDQNQLTEVTIPNSVTTMGIYIFSDNQITNFTLPNGITTVPEGMFWWNKLTSVIVPNGIVTIKDSAFADNSIKNVLIPASVKTIEGFAFESNELESLTLPSSVTTIGEGAFYVNRLTNVIIPTSVTTIGDFAFNENQLPDNQAFIYARNANGTENTSRLVSYGGSNRTNVIVPNTVTTVGGWAFSDNKLISIFIPNSVTIIEEWAFAYSELTSVTIPTSVTTIERSAFNDNQLPDNQAFIYARNPDGTENTSKIVSYGGTNRSNVVIPNSVTNIGEYAFYNTLLTNITIPNTVTTIGQLALYYNLLTSIFIPNSVITIGTSAFRYNYITQGNAQIDNSVGNVTIGSYVFNNNGTNRSTTITPTYLR